MNETRDSFLSLAGACARSIVFQVFFVLWTFLGSVAVYVTVFLLGFRELLVKGCVVWCKGLEWGAENIIGLKTRMVGRENLPQGAFILACRHQSAWETFQMPHWFPHAAIVLKEELLRVPFWGKCMQMFGAIPVARSGKGSDLKNMLKAAKAYAGENRALIIFPQGTRTRPGVRRPYGRGVGVLYEMLKLPVVPMNLNSGEFWGRRSFLKFPGMVDVIIHPAIPPGLPREEFMERLENILEVDIAPQKKG